MKSRCRTLRPTPTAAGLGLTALAALLAAGSAQARTEILRWTHDRPSDVLGKLSLHRPHQLTSVLQIRLP